MLVRCFPSFFGSLITFLRYFLGFLNFPYFSDHEAIFPYCRDGLHLHHGYSFVIFVLNSVVFSCPLLVQVCGRSLASCCHTGGRRAGVQVHRSRQLSTVKNGRTLARYHDFPRARDPGPVRFGCQKRNWG
jgi:hypothetical protein